MKRHSDALAARARIHSGASSPAHARGAASRPGLTVVCVQARGLSLPRFRRAAKFPTLLFSVELMALLEAGLNLVEALHALRERQMTGEPQRVLCGIVAAIERGESFSRAVAAFPRHFSPLYVATLKASERTGNIKEALARYIGYQEELERVRKKIVSATIYPAILMVVGAAVLAFLMLYVVPRFARVYEDVSASLPFFSSLLLALGRGIQAYGWILGLGLAALAAAAAYGITRPEFRAWVNRRLWRMPALGERMKTYQLARLYRTLGMLLRAGVPALQALDMVGDLLAAHLRPRLYRARTMIEQGRQLSAAFGATGLGTAVALRMMAVAERSGEMGEMLGKIAHFHDEETARFIDWFMRAFEPVLMAILGIAVGLVVVLMYMPIFELAGSLQ